MYDYYYRLNVMYNPLDSMPHLALGLVPCMLIPASLVGLLHLILVLPVLHVCRHGGGVRLVQGLLKGHTNISGELVRVLALVSYSCVYYYVRCISHSML